MKPTDKRIVQPVFSKKEETELTDYAALQLGKVQELKAVLSRLESANAYGRTSPETDGQIRLLKQQVAKAESDYDLLAGLGTSRRETTQRLKAIQKHLPTEAEDSLLDRAAAASTASHPSPATSIAMRGSTVALDQLGRPVDFHRARFDFVYFCEAFLPILYRTGMVNEARMAQVAGADFAAKVARGEIKQGPMVLTDHQEMEVNLFCEILFVRKEPLRAAVLKSRQLGNTIVLLAFALWLQVFHAPFNVMLIIDKDEHALTKKLQWLEWVEGLAMKWPELRVSLAMGGRTRKTQKLNNNSLFVFESSTSDNPGTSDQFHMHIYSEKPKWRHGVAELVSRSVEPTISMRPMTVVIDESTANGQDSFYRKWGRITALGAPTEVVPIFLAWFKSLEYSAKAPLNFAFSSESAYRDFDPRNPEREILEEEFAVIHNLTDDQVWWRRKMIRDTFQGDRTSFDQEYPTTPLHAFRSVGTQYFATKFTEQLDRRSKTEAAPARYVLMDLGGYRDTSRELHFSRLQPGFAPWSKGLGDLHGTVIVREPPRKDKQYFAGTDVAEGKTTKSERGDSDPDWSVTVICDQNGQQCAVMFSRLRAEELWLAKTMFCAWYNFAVWNGEINGPGNTLLTRLYGQVNYPNLFWDVADKGKTNQSEQERTWMRVTKANRDPLLSLLRQTWSNDPTRPMVWDTDVFDETSVGQIGSFIRHSSGKYEAADGFHDDYILASAHSEYCRTRWLGLDQDSVPAPVPEVVPVADLIVRSSQHWLAVGGLLTAEELREVFVEALEPSERPKVYDFGGESWDEKPAEAASTGWW